jgi:putative transposase
VTADRTFFVTTVTAQRRPLFRYEANARLLLQTLLDYRSHGKYLLHDFVIMPDHLHLLITPADDISLERAIQFIKGGFSFRLKSKLAVWQESFTNHRIRDQEDLERHCEYIRMNPVRAGLMGRPDEYQYSSAAHPRLDEVPPGLKPCSVAALARP